MKNQWYSCNERYEGTVDWPEYVVKYTTSHDDCTKENPSGCEYAYGIDMHFTLVSLPITPTPPPLGSKFVTPETCVWHFCG